MPAPETIIGYHGLPDDGSQYSTNPYVLGLAIANTPCFGEHDAADGMCGTCPIKGPCISKRYAEYSKAAIPLDQRDTEAAAQKVFSTAMAASAPVRKPAPVQDLSVDDLLAQAEAGHGKPAAPVTPAKPSNSMPDLGDLFNDLPNRAQPPAPVAAVPTGTRHVPVTASRDTPCQVCKKTIPRGSQTLFLPDVGFKHVGC